MQTALGAVLRDDGARQQPCGVFGSFGWSGEAVDEMESRLKVKQTLPSGKSSIWCLLHTTLQSIRRKLQWVPKFIVTYGAFKGPFGAEYSLCVLTL